MTFVSSCSKILKLCLLEIIDLYLDTNDNQLKKPTFDRYVYIYVKRCN